MKSLQAERLNRVLMQDKSSSPQRTLPALKSDLRDVLRAYGELLEDITVDIQDGTDAYSVMMIAKIVRFK